MRVERRAVRNPAWVTSRADSAAASMGVASRICSVRASLPVRMARELARLINVISEPICPEVRA